MNISFKRIQSKIRLHNPLKGFSLDEIPFEIRYDPLTGRKSMSSYIPDKCKSRRTDGSNAIITIAMILSGFLDVDGKKRAFYHFIQDFI